MSSLLLKNIEDGYITDHLIIKDLKVQPYVRVWDAMKAYASSKDSVQDELWVVQHDPVYTRGIRCKEIPVPQAMHIPLVPVDRGGLMTYHGPGQIILYGLMDINRKGINIKQVVSAYEQSVINLLAHYRIDGSRIDGAPGVYVEGKKIASIGIRVKNNKTYHGLSVNFDMDLTPFSWINTCGFADLEVTQLRSLVRNFNWQAATDRLLSEYVDLFGYSDTKQISHSAMLD